MEAVRAKGIAVSLPPPAGGFPGKVRKRLSADALFASLRSRFERITDRRRENASIALTDGLMSAFAMFSLKDPSLLAFEQRRNDENMKNLYRILTVPSDTRMREILDPLKPEDLRALFVDVLRQLQRGKALEPFVFYQGCYRVSKDK